MTTRRLLAIGAAFSGLLMPALASAQGTPTLNRGGLVVLGERPVAAPIVAQPAPAPAAVAVQPVAVQPVVLQPPSSSAIEGFGKDVPLSMAVRQIVPADMLVNIDGVDANSRVSWSGGGDWHAVLERLAASRNARVSYEGQLVRIQGMGAAAQPPAAAPIVLQPASPRVVAAPVVVAAPSTVIVEPATVPEARETPRQRAERLRAERAAEREARLQSSATGREPPIRNAQPVQRPPVTSGTWRATKNESLDHVLADWGDRAGWTVVYNSQVIYDIQSGAEFTGDFTEAVASLVRSVRARPVPSVIFYRGNKTLVVSNNIDGN